MKSRIIFASILLAVLGVAGCAGTDAHPAADTPTGTNAAPSASPSQPDITYTQEPEESTSTPVENLTAKFGKTYRWDTGLSITVSTPKATSQGGGSGGESFKHFVSFTVVVVNRTGAPFDASSIYTSIQSNDVEGEEVFDSEHGYIGPPETKLLNGRQAKYKIKYGLSNPLDIVMELAPGMELDSVIWTS